MMKPVRTWQSEVTGAQGESQRTSTCPAAHTLLACGLMQKPLFRGWALLALLGRPVGAAERAFDFSNLPENQPPPGFRSTVSGKGKPGDWKIILDEVPPLLAPLTAQEHVLTKRAVLAQMAVDPTDEHFPLLIYQDESFGDFTLTTRLKTVSGVTEQMAGIAFRIQNET